MVRVRVRMRFAGRTCPGVQQSWVEGPQLCSGLCDQASIHSVDEASESPEKPLLPQFRFAVLSS